MSLIPNDEDRARHQGWLAGASAAQATIDALKARLAEALFLLNRWHEAYHADGGMEMLDDDTTTCLAGITVSAACEWCKPDARCPDHGAACIEDIEGVTDSAPAAPRCERCGDSGWIQGNPVIGISDEPCGCDERDASTAPAVTYNHFPGQTACEWCHGTGAIDAPTSADDPSCPECDGEGHV